jgi:integrase/recombinase XerD
VLWSCGLRRSEIARLEIADVNFSEGFLIIRTSKTGKPRIAPLSPTARHALRKHIGKRSQGSLFGMTTNAIRLCLMRLGAPSAHAWRRGWAVQALRSGVSETSVRAAAGWSSGVMVARYTSALSGELAVDEFHRGWNN